MTPFHGLADALTPKHTIRSGAAKGLRLTMWRPDPTMVGGTYERPIQEALCRILSPGDVFYDIGANVGFLSLLVAARVGRSGRVYAFEPVPRNAATIRRNARLNAFDWIDVFTEAVGDTCDTAELRLARHIGGAALASTDPPPDVCGSIQVQVTTLDRAIVQRQLRPPSVIKIDVEGAEVQVFAGMVETLAKHRPQLIFEIDAATRDDIESKVAATSRSLRSAGYVLSPIADSYGNDAWQVRHFLALPG